MVLIAEDGSETVATGSCEGQIGFEPVGDAGFGYDPLFLPQATPGRTMAQLSLAEKNAISHRGAALAALRALLRDQ
jgi:XTP/dITP diphosphohydrolase